MSPRAEVVVAGGGIAAAATALRLRSLGFGVRMLVRPSPGVDGIEALPERALGLLDVLGEPTLAAEAGGVLVAAPGPSGPAGREVGPGGLAERDGLGQAPPSVHVDRLALARVFLERARERGASVEEVRRLPPCSAMPAATAGLVDATGRAAAWSRPLRVEGSDVAWQFEGPPQPDLALRVVQGDGWWSYRLGTPTRTWAGVVTAGAGPAPEQGIRRLGLDPGVMAPRGRRAARVQRSAHPVGGLRLAVGDAALAHDPIAGAGIRFALASAIAAATAIATWVADPDRRSLAAAYYDEVVTGEHGRHLAARRAIHAGDVEARPAGPMPVPDVVCFTAPVVDAPLVIDGEVRPGAAIRLPDGTLTRWLGSFDLLVLARLSAEPTPRIVLLARLQSEGLAASTARSVLSWAVRHGLLAGAR